MGIIQILLVFSQNSYWMDYVFTSSPLVGREKAGKQFAKGRGELIRMQLMLTYIAFTFTYNVEVVVDEINGMYFVLMICPNTRLVKNLFLINKPKKVNER